jgi:hypothetical protein
MSRSREIFTARIRIATVFLSLAALGPGRAAGQEPRVGTVQTLPVITLALNVGSTEKEEKRVVYAPPPGWHIRSHRVDCTRKYGLSSFTVSTVPADWCWSADESATAAATAKVEAAVQAHGAGGQAKALNESRKTTAEHEQRTSSHHALVVEATAKGAGWLRSGGGIELTVTAELVYVGSGNPGVSHAVAAKP